MLKNLIFSKDFIMYAYGEEKSITDFIAQKNDQEEYPIAFHSQTLHNYQKRYSFIEKQAFSIMKGLKKLKHYVSHNKILIYTIHLDVRNYIIQKELGKGKVGWITKIMEYDVEITTTKLIKGWTLYKNMADATHIISIIEDEELANQESHWIKQFMFYFRTRKYPESLDRFKIRGFRL